MLIAVGWVGLSLVRKTASASGEREVVEGISRKTKLDRDRSGKRETPGAREELHEKREEGMTDREVRWIAEDFLALGLDQDHPGGMTGPDYLAARRRRGEWFAKAVEQAYSLSNEQSAEMRESIRAMEDGEYVKLREYLDGRKSFEHEGRQYMVVSAGELRKFSDAEQWLGTEGYQPWNLCTLTPEQTELTWQAESGSKRDEMNFDLSFKDLLPDGSVEIGEAEFSSKRQVELEGGRFVPYSSSQLADILGALEKQSPGAINSLHPSQLKYILLRNPELALKILGDLSDA